MLNEMSKIPIQPGKSRGAGKKTPWQSWINGLLGLWLVVAAFLGFSHIGNLVNYLIVGLAVVIVSLALLKEKPWQAWIALILGIWMVASSLVLPLHRGAGYVYNDLLTGLVIAIVGFTGLSTSQNNDDMPHIQHTVMHS